MKKLFLFASIMLLAACSANFELPIENVKTVSKNSFKISEEEALQRLEKALNAFETTTRGKKRTIKEVIPRIKPQTRSGSINVSDTLYYYVNFDNNEGYAVVAADKRAIPILALIDTGNYTPPQSYIDWVNDIIDSLDLICPPEEGDDDFWCFLPDDPDNTLPTLGLPEDLFDGYVSALNSQYVKTLVEFDVQNQYGPYLKTTWGQNIPYNSMCAAYNYNQEFFYNDTSPRTNYVAGCVAVAIAQIINYHKYPSVYRGQTFNWDLTENTKNITLSSHTDTIKEVARIIRAAGLAAKTEYGYEASSSKVKNAKKAFQNELGYVVVKKNGFNESDIINSLHNQEPVFFAGKKNKLNAGHAWVIDGYRSCKVETWKVAYRDSTYTDILESYCIDEKNDYFYHCNFGWDGDLNGYYAGDIFRLNEGPVMLDQIDEPADPKYYKWWKFRNIFVKKP